MPINHATGENIQPMIRCSVSDSPPTTNDADHRVDERDEADEHHQHRADVDGQSQTVGGPARDRIHDAAVRQRVGDIAAFGGFLRRNHDARDDDRADYVDDGGDQDVAQRAVDHVAQTRSRTEP